MHATGGKIRYHIINHRVRSVFAPPLINNQMIIGLIMLVICAYVIYVQYDELKIRERDKNKYNQ